MEILTPGQGYYWGMGPGMMNWGSGISWVWHIVMLAFWVALIVGIIFLIRWLILSGPSGSQRMIHSDSALEILKKRYARGEIDKQEYEAKKKDILG